MTPGTMGRNDVYAAASGTPHLLVVPPLRCRQDAVGVGTGWRLRMSAVRRPCEPPHQGSALLPNEDEPGSCGPAGADRLATDFGGGQLEARNNQVCRDVRVGSSRRWWGEASAAGAFAGDGKRVVSLEPVSINHADRIQALVSNAEILASTMLPDPYPDDGVVKWIQGLGKKMGGSTEYGFAVISDAKEIVGTCGFILPTEDMDVAEIGYWVGRAYWNHGYATQALRLLLDRVFKDDKIMTVRACTLKSNRASCRVLEKLGFAVSREVPNEHPKWSRQELVRHYEVRREDWASPPV